MAKTTGKPIVDPLDKPRVAGRVGVALAAGLIVLAGLAAYCGSFRGAFIFDDFDSIPDNWTIRHLSDLGVVLSPPRDTTVAGRPVLNLSLAINYAIGGPAVWGYHAGNLAIHIAACLLLFGIVRRTLILPRFSGRFDAAATWLALAVALVWGLHPLQTEAVTYMIQRAESLMGLFYLLTLYAVIRGAGSPRAARLWQVLAVAACALGMGTKEVMVTAPVIVLLYDRTFLAGTFREALRRRGPLYVGLAATWAILAALVWASPRGQSAGFAMAGISGTDYAAAQPGVILHYLRLAFWPSGLVLDYSDWPPARDAWAILLPGIAILALLGLTVWALRRRPAWGFLGAWFFIILSPTSSIVPIADIAFEHRMYLPLAGVAAAVTLGAYVLYTSLMGRRPDAAPTNIRDTVIRAGAAVAIVAALAGLGVLTYLRNQDYRTEISIWQDTLRKAPRNWRAHINLGVALCNAGRTPEAVEHYQRALQLSPSDPKAHNNLGAALVELHRTPEAIEHYQQALRVKPDYAKAHNNLGVALAELHRGPEAMEEYREALRLNPRDAEAHNNLGNALTDAGRAPEAIEQYNEALRLAPEYVEAHYNLGVALMELRRVGEAIVHYREALRLKPDYAKAHSHLGVALSDAGRGVEAIEHLQRAVALKGDDAEAHDNLGVALGNAGRIPEAIEHFREALRLDPNSADARKNLQAAEKLSTTQSTQPARPQQSLPKP